MTAIFISHRSSDNAQAQALKDWLGQQGHEQLFLDFDPADGIPAGVDWEQRLYQELRRCQALLIVLTPAWLESKWCGNELAIAREKGKAVFVVRVKACPGGPVIPAIQEVDLTLDRDANLAKLARGLGEHGLDPRDAFDWKPDRPIYPGLAAFDVDDAAIFFGRSEESWQVVEALRRMRLQATGSPKLLLITGASGSGKSSLMRAGVLARLRKEPASWITARPFRRGTDALGALAEALAWALPPDRRPTSLEAITARLAGPDGAAQLLALARELRLARDRPEATLVLALDQAEELLAAERADDAGKLLDLFRTTLALVGNEILVLATIRSDRLAAWQQHASIKATVDHGELPFEMLPLGPMPMARIGEIVRGPAAYEGLHIDDDLVDAIRADTVSPDALPLLAYTLQYLHRQFAQDGRLTLAEYRSVGGLEGSVRSQADAAIPIEKLSEEDRRALRDAFVPGLVRATAQGGFSRSRALLATLPPRAEPHLRRLIDEARLLTTDTDPQGGVTVEVAHESLLRVWPTLARWITEDAESLRRLEAMQRAAQDWAHAGRGEDFLVHRDHRLADAEMMIAEPRFAARLESADRDYLAACRNAQNQREAAEKEAQERDLRAAQQLAEEQKAKTRRTRIGMAVALALAVVAAGLGGWGWNRAGEAERQADEASRQKEEAERQANAAELARKEAVEQEKVAKAEAERAQRKESLLLAQLAEQQTARGDSVTGMLLALRGLPATFDPPDRPVVGEAVGALTAAWARRRELVVLHGHDRGVTAAAFSADGARVVTASEDGTARVWAADGSGAPVVLRGHEDYVRSAAFSPDGTRVVTASDDSTARVWAADGSGAPVVLRGHEGVVPFAAFSPDGTRVVTASDDGTARVWAADGSGEPVVLRGHEGVVRSAAFSPDETRVVTASEDGTARVWAADGNGAPVVLRGHEDVIFSAAFSPDGTRVVTASNDRTARVWAADGSGAPVVLRGHEGAVWFAAFSPDGTRVVTSFPDDTARVWAADGSGEPVVLRGHESSLDTAAFSPDGAYVVTASRDSTARVWDAYGVGEPVVLRGHESWVAAAVFSPDGARVVTASDDGTARVWAADGSGAPVVLRGHAGAVYDAEFSPDGTRVVMASYDGTARVWAADGSGEPVDRQWDVRHVYDVAFSPDGARVVAASADRTARVWTADGSGEPVVLRGHENEVNSAAFSPDGARVVTASDDGTARIWAADGTGEPVVLRGHEKEVNSAAFSPDGAYVVTASRDNTARVWDADGVGEPVVLRGHEFSVNAVAFSPDGARIVTASADGTARVWAADGSGAPVVLRGHAGAVYYAEFSPDGARIVTASADGTARVWAADGSGAPVVLRGHAGAVYYAEFSPSGTRVVTASADGTARVWTADGSGEPVVLRGHAGEVRSAGFSPDGTRVVTSSEDGTAMLWPWPLEALIDAARAAVPRQLTPQQEQDFFLIETSARAPAEAKVEPALEKAQ